MKNLREKKTIMNKSTIILFLIFVFMYSCEAQDTLIKRFATTLIKEDVSSEVYLSLPIQLNKEGKCAKLIIPKSGFIKYMTSVDSIKYSNRDTLSNYLAQVLLCEKKFSFSEFVYTNILKLGGHKILYDNNTYLKELNKNTFSFLSKAIDNYNEKDIHFSLSDYGDFFKVIDALFQKKLVVGLGDGYIGVLRVQ